MKTTAAHPIRHLAWLVLLVLTLGPRGGPAAASKLPEPHLEGYYDRWLASVAALISDDERRAFEALAEDLHRELFIHGFWQARRPSSEAPSPALARWHQNFEEAGHRFDSLDSDPAQALMMAGKPARVVVFAGCRSVIRPLRIWSFPPWHADPNARPGTGDFYLVFIRDATTDVYRQWEPQDGIGPLMFLGPSRASDWSVEDLISYAVSKNCFKWQPEEARPFAAALRDAWGPEKLQRLTLPPLPDPDWLEPWAHELNQGAPVALPTRSVEISFPGRYQTKTLVLGRIAIPIERVERNAEGFLFDRIVIVGDVRLGDRLVDAFRVVHLVAGSEPESALVTLDFYRRLRPGAYTLSLRVEDADGLGLLRETLPLTVPKVESEAQPPAGHRLGLPGLTRAEVGVLTTFPSIEILPSEEEPLVGDSVIEVVTTGGPIERVELLLGGALAATDTEPPYAVTLPLGGEPRQHRLDAIAFDPAGREIARDTLTLNSGPRRFAVRLVEPTRGSLADRARVEIDVPRDDPLEQVELFLNQRRIAALKEPPFTAPLPPAMPGVATYVRAVATLASGATMEDLVFLYSPDPFDQIDVQLVEVYASVLDDAGRFVTGLTAEDFRVLEDGVEQTIQRFDKVSNQAINVALSMDVSASMRKKIGIAISSAQRFFETVLTPKDRASFLTFNHDIRRVVPFTADVDDLRYAVDGFRAWGTTRLNDSIIYAVHSFGGLAGKRALVLLSDGQDVDSDFTFKQVLEYTLRSRVAVYPIALQVEDPLTVTHLEKLADESGGRFFRIAGVGELARIYRQIEEELRSQYLLVYEPPPNARRHAFRRVEVDMVRPGLRVRAIQGYYP